MNLKSLGRFHNILGCPKHPDVRGQNLLFFLKKKKAYLYLKELHEQKKRQRDLPSTDSFLKWPENTQQD